jgi:hypothetical protein
MDYESLIPRPRPAKEDWQKIKEFAERMRDLTKKLNIVIIMPVGGKRGNL